jgi:hypothetical protein
MKCVRGLKRKPVYTFEDLKHKISQHIQAYETADSMLGHCLWTCYLVKNLVDTISSTLYQDVDGMFSYSLTVEEARQKLRNFSQKYREFAEEINEFHQAIDIIYSEEQFSIQLASLKEYIEIIHTMYQEEIDVLTLNIIDLLPGSNIDSWVPHNLHFSYRSAIALCKVLKDTEIVKLFLNNSRFGDEGCRILVEELQSSQKLLHVLNVSYSNISDIGAKHLASLVPKIRSLDIVGNLVTEQGIEYLKRAAVCAQSINQKIVYFDKQTRKVSFFEPQNSFEFSQKVANNPPEDCVAYQNMEAQELSDQHFAVSQEGIVHLQLLGSE